MEFTHIIFKKIFRKPLSKVIIILYIILAVFSEYWLGIYSHIKIGDDFYIYYQSFINALSGGNPYLPYKIGDSFINHPFLLSLIGLIGWHKIISLSLLIWISISISAWFIVIRISVFLIQMSKTREGCSNEKDYRFYFFAFLVLFAPFLETIHIGQINVLVILAILLTYHYSESDKPFVAGFFMSMAIVLKTSPVIFVIYFLSLRNYRLIFSSIFFLLFFTLIPLIQFSTSIFNYFLVILSNLSTEIQSNPYNQSILSFMTRILSKLHYTNYEDLLRLSHQILLIITLSVILIPNFFRRPSKVIRLWQFALVLIVMTIFSPLIWYHHSVFLIFPIILLGFCSKTLYGITSIIIIFAIQVERLFEYWIINVSAPVIISHYILLIFMMYLYFNFISKSFTIQLSEDNKYGFRQGN
jgi:hypothetical protein